MTNMYTRELLQNIINQKLSTTIQDDDFYYLYKYLSFDQEMYVLDTFNKTQLKYTKPEDFNDPYDCSFITEVDLSDFNKRNAEITLDLKIPAKRWLNDKAKIKTAIKNAFSNNFTNDYKNKIAVTCFTDDPLNILMWSHYAKNHTGFIIEFKIQKNYKPLNSTKDFNVPFPVTYTDKYPQILLNWKVDDESLNNLDYQTDLLAKMVLIKSECWSYENEFRSIVFDSKSDENIILRQFDPNVVSSVIVGSRIKENHFNELKKSINNFNSTHKTNVQIYHSQMMDDQYKLQVKSHPLINKK